MIDEYLIDAKRAAMAEVIFVVRVVVGVLLEFFWHVFHPWMMSFFQ